MINNFILTAIYSCQYSDSSALRMFDCACYVLASKDCDLDQAMEDAININAQDVQELNDNDQKCFEVIKIGSLSFFCFQT